VWVTGTRRRSVAALAGDRPESAAVEELAPEPVGVATGFGAAGQVALGGHDLIVRSLATGGVLLAVAEVENLQSRVGKRLTAGTPSTGDDGTIGQVLAHDRGQDETRRRRPSDFSLAAFREIHEENHSRLRIQWGVDALPPCTRPEGGSLEVSDQVAVGRHLRARVRRAHAAASASPLCVASSR